MRRLGIAQAEKKQLQSVARWQASTTTVQSNDIPLPCVPDRCPTKPFDGRKAFMIRLGERDIFSESLFRR